MTMIKDPAHMIESEVRSYARSFPVVFTTAKNDQLFDEQGNAYIDFLAGAGTLNYGHNNDQFKTALINYIEQDGIVHGLDMTTRAKYDFLETFNEIILKSRQLDYRVQFCGPTGTNAVEAALKIARKVKGRPNVMAFTNGYHGMTSGALAVTGNFFHKENIPGTYSNFTTFMPYCGYSDNVDDSIAYMRQYIEDNSSGVNKPAAIILETIQGEGGINVASPRWLRGIRQVCNDYGILLIIDDIQMGNGRTGDFFSFEEAGIEPDIVLLSKSIGAYGLPFALVLIKPEYDQWKPAEHNGTFRGHNLAFVAAKEALDNYWQDNVFSDDIKKRGELIHQYFLRIAKRYPKLDLDVRGRGFVWGIESFALPELASMIHKKCFQQNLIIETCGSVGQVLKFLGPLTITDDHLKKGLSIIEKSFEQVVETLQSNKSEVTS